MTVSEAADPSDQPRDSSVPTVTARRAGHADITELVRLYRLLEAEMARLKPVWGITEGIPEPIEASFGAVLDDPAVALYVGAIDAVAVGFLLGRSEPMLPQAGGDRIAAIRLIFVEAEAREMGVGEAMLSLFRSEHRASHRYFDAHVSPGHRVAKNFFESNGFKARHIVMHRDAGADD